MLRETFIDLLAKKISGTLSNKDAQLLINAVNDNEEYHKIYDELLDFSTNVYYPSNDHINHQLNRVWQQIDSEKTIQNHSRTNRLSFKYLMRIAASLILGVSAVLLIVEYKKEDFTVVQTTSAARVIQLIDGSRIRLDAHSGLEYNKGYAKTGRQMNFYGAAVFDIATNKAMPLYISINNIRIKVKGTLFSVNTISSKNTEIALLSGSITIYHEIKKSDSVTLLPDQRIIVSNSTDHFTYQIDQVDIATRSAAAFSDTLRFNNRRLEALIEDLSKKYHVQFEIKNQSLKEVRFSGVFTNEKLEQALEALKISYPIKYTITAQKITIE